MSPLTIKMLLLFIGCLALGAAGSVIKSTYDEYLELKEFKVQAEANAEATSSNIESLGKQVAARQVVEIKVSDQRAATERAYEELKREDKVASDWAAQRIPDSVRRLDAAPETNDGVANDPGGDKSAHRASPRRRQN